MLRHPASSGPCPGPGNASGLHLPQESVTLRIIELSENGSVINPSSERTCDIGDNHEQGGSNYPTSSLISNRSSPIDPDYRANVSVTWYMWARAATSTPALISSTVSARCELSQLLLGCAVHTNDLRTAPATYEIPVLAGTTT
jgi:hypothetical protein